MSSKTQQKSLPSGNGLSNLQSSRSNTRIKIDNISAPLSSQKLSPSQTEHNSNIYNGMLKYSQDYAQKSKTLMSLLNNTCSILKQVRETNKQRWDLYYPFSSQTPGLKSLYNDGSAFESNTPTQMSKFKQKVYDQLHTDMSSSQEFNSKLTVLKLDLKKGHTSSAVTVFEELNKSAIATLLDSHFAQTIKRCESLHARISDTSSKVLVAGDVNAGKSTFVNSLLRRNVMPVDQQPCTTLFCEVLDVQDNDGIEEIHAIKDITSYKRTDSSTYTVIAWKDLYDIIVNNEESGDYTQLKVYTKDRRNAQESLLHNGIVDIALIDCPGLNRDTLKTTALFTRQEEIDVIIFVVSAENHFTLSAKEFLSNASKEKAYLFIVVNKFDNIRHKEKCKRAILEQIKEVSPRTHEHAKDLVHFVTSTSITVEKDDDDVNDAADKNVDDMKSIEDFSRLEESLRTFVLKKRSKSKLAPAQHYLDNLVTDIGILVEFNRNIAQQENDKANLELKEAERAYNKLVSDQKAAVATAEKVETHICEEIQNFARNSLERAIENVGKTTLCEYHGLLYIWSYANDLRDLMLDDIQKEIMASEENAKNQTAQCIELIQDLGKDLGGEFKKINLDRMYIKPGMSISVNVEISDFIEFDLNERFSEGLGFVGLAGGAVMCAGTKLNALSCFWDFTNFVGFNNMRRLALPLIGLAGCILYCFISFFLYIYIYIFFINILYICWFFRIWNYCICTS
jgi:mitofusin 2